MNAPNVPYSHGHYIGGKETSTHAIWRGMLARCRNPRSKSYPLYGAIGVCVAQEWLDVGKFFADMGERPPGLELDRYPDPNGDYKPDNCRWATRSQNQRNKRNTRYFRIGGKVLTASEAAAELGISRALFTWRKKRGDYEYA